MKDFVCVVGLFLVSCAIVEPMAVHPSCDDADMICDESEYCVDASDGPICVRVPRLFNYCDYSCPEGRECRGSTCVAPDLSGSGCEWDEDCPLDALCIAGHCTPMPCFPGDTIPCYSGEEGTVGVGECRAGFYLCTESYVYTQECIGEVLPASDAGYLACNGRDDNCDGVSDPLNTEFVDVIFALDLSQSMLAENAACISAIRQTAAMYNHHSLRMGLVTFPDPIVDQGLPASPKVAIPLVEYSQFEAQMNYVSLSVTFEHKEPSYDVPWLIANGLMDGIVRRPGARLIIIIFTDEQGQSYLDPAVTEEDVCIAIDGVDIGLYVVTYQEGRYWTSGDRSQYSDYWDDCATLLELSEDVTETVSTLTEIAESVCD